jgi:hypothetical protein
MVHERDDEYEGQEDGEYHFSDDQANYEMEPEAAADKPAAAATATASSPAAPAGAAGAKKSMRRPIVGVVVIAVVGFLLYKILSPSPTLQTSDFNQTTVATKTTTKKVVVPKKEKVIVKTTPVEQPAAPAAPMVSTTTVTTPAPAPNQPMVTTTTMPAPAMAGQPGAAPQQQTPVVVQITPPASTTTVTTAPEASAGQVSAEIDKLISLQDQNTKLINQFQAESAQKITEYETQNNEMQGKLQDMNLRLNSLEATITHLTKVLQDTSTRSAPVSRMEGQQQVEAPVQMMARPMPMPKSMYTVQAIIPGRAWLKSDNGETVTVAEGDILRNYGKIIKIDPYDGVVQIDVGGRVVSLSYGASAE